MAFRGCIVPGTPAHPVGFAPGNSGFEYAPLEIEPARCEAQAGVRVSTVVRAPGSSDLVKADTHRRHFATRFATKTVNAPEPSRTSPTPSNLPEALASSAPLAC